MSTAESPTGGREDADVAPLLARARAGDIEAFSELCRLLGRRLLRHATALCGDAALAEDLAQETLVEVWKHIRRFHGRCQFFTWLCAILLNRYRNVRRRKRPQPLSAFDGKDRARVEFALENLPDHAPAPDQASSLAERAAFLRHCIDALPSKQRQVIYLRFYVDHSLEHIAAALGCSLGTVKSRLFHALERLRAMRRADHLHVASAPTPPSHETVFQK